MADMPTKHFLQPGAQARSSGAAQLIPELPEGLDPALAQRVAAAWEYLAPSQRALLLQLARQIDEAEAKVALLEREAQRRARITHNQGAIQLLQAWIEEDKQGDRQQQQQEWEALQQALDADRLSDRPLFPRP